MKKNKLVLLTVLIVMVLYCGAVIFVTKPNTNAYAAIFGSVDNKVTVPAAAETAPVDTDAILAVAEKYTDDAVADALAVNEDAVKAIVDKAVADALAVNEDAVKAIVDKAVADAFANLEFDGDTIIQTQPFDINEHLDEIVNAVVPELLKYEDELAALIYDKYKDQLVDMVVDELIERLPSDVSVDANDYDTIRRQMREAEIKKMLEQLHD